MDSSGFTQHSNKDNMKTILKMIGEWFERFLPDSDFVEIQRMRGTYDGLE